MILWRISNYADLNGAGGVLHSGRWHHRGRPVVYLAQSPAGALLEALVHVEAASPSDLPASYQLLEVELPDHAGLIIEADLAANHLHQLTRTRRCGDAWLASGASLLLRVPSVVVGRTHNLLFNPAHPLATQCRVVSVARHPFDMRLVGGPGR
jgi:RES domain-containing protein